MTKQDDNKFDLEIRSLLSGAEESVPDSVWEGVSSALLARRRVVLMRRIGLVASLAAAAALVVGVFLFKDPSVIPSEVEESLLSASSFAPASGSGDVAGPAQNERRCEIEVGTCAGNPVSVASSVAGHGQEIAPATEVPGTCAADAIPTGDATAIPSEAEGGAKVSGSGDVAGPGEEIAPATNEAETSDNAAPAFDLTHPDADLTGGSPTLGKAPRRLLALSAGGLMETNGNPVRSTFTGYRANGTVLPKTGVREHGDNGSYGVPFSLGLGLQWHFAPRWALGTGLTYSCLSRSFTGTYTVTEGDAVTFQITSNIDNSIHYLGVPLQLSYSLTGDGPVQCYTFAGAALEKGLTNRFRIKDAESDIIYKEHVDGVQLSFNLGLGVRFPMTDRVGLYLDPSLHYYPDCGQPRSIRTRQKLMFSLEAGLRFDL